VCFQDASPNIDDVHVHDLSLASVGLNLPASALAETVESCTSLLLPL